MTDKPKTLKDCYMSDGRNFEQRLREEAIRHITHFYKKINTCCKTKDFCKECAERYAVIVYIKWNNNLTEDDLK